MESRAAPDSKQLIAVPRTAGGFLSLLVQRKKPKKARPGARDIFLRSSPHWALANSSAARQRGSTRTGARLNTPGGAAVLGARYGGIENTDRAAFELDSSGTKPAVIKRNKAQFKLLSQSEKRTLCPYGLNSCWVLSGAYCCSRSSPIIATPYIPTISFSGEGSYSEKVKQNKEASPSSG